MIETAPLQAYQAIVMPWLFELPRKTQLLTGTPVEIPPTTGVPALSMMPATLCNDCRAEEVVSAMPTSSVLPAVVAAPGVRVRLLAAALLLSIF